jgi:hypothetical protein
MTRKDSLIVLLFLLLAGGMGYGTYFLVNEVESLRETDKFLRTQSLQLELQAAEQVRQIEVYKKAIAALERYQLELPENEVDFYAWTQQELTRNGVRSNVVKPGSSPPQGRNAVQVDFQGPYYGFVKTFSDWRNLKVALRLSSVTMNMVDGDTVRGVAIVESVLKK